ncbi:MAG: hypothetical protein PHD97_03500 [Bacteroidales bacterium]|nr:hypothetical protein [Bacteroidales bacterium]
MSKKLFLFLFSNIIAITILFNNTFAQNKEEVYVKSAYKPILADANKILSNPKNDDTAGAKPKMIYLFNPVKFDFKYKVASINPAKVSGVPLAKLYKSLIKAGYGNYNTPYLEIFVNSLRSSKYSMGTHFKHLSSSANFKNFGYSGFSNNNASVYAKRFYGRYILSSEAEFDRNVVHYYGYDTSEYRKNHSEMLSKDAIKQCFVFIKGEINLASNYTDTIHSNYSANLRYYNFSDIFNVGENNVLFKGSVSKYVNVDKQLENEKLIIPLVINYNNNTNFATGTLNNTLINIKPQLNFSIKDLKMNIGLNTFIEAGDESEAGMCAYPSIDANLSIVENMFIVYGGIDGNDARNSLKSVADENPFISTPLKLKNTYDKFDFYGGVRGSISPKIYFNARFINRNLKNLLLFTNDRYDSLKATQDIYNMFDVLYDEAKLMNICGEIGYQNSEKIRFSLKGNYYKYDMEHELKAWHKPLYDFTLSTNYNLRNKIIAKLDLIALGNHYVKTSDPLNRIKEEDGIFEINLGLEYRYTKIISIFLNFNNISAARYYKWNGYPSQGFNFLGGITYAL